MWLLNVRIEQKLKEIAEAKELLRSYAVEEKGTIQHSKRLKLNKLHNNFNFKIKNKSNIVYNTIISLKIKKFSFNNNLILLVFQNKIKFIKKYIYFFFKFLLHLTVMNLTLIEIDTLLFLKYTNIIFINFIDYKNKILAYTKINYIWPNISFNTININLTLYNSILLFSILLIMKLNNFATKKYNFLLQKNLYMFFFNFNKNYTWNRPKNIKFSLINLYIYKFLFSFLYTRKINNITPNILKFFLLKFNKKNINTLKFLLWKNNNLVLQKKIKNKLPTSYLYFIHRIEDKLDFLLFEKEQNLNKIKKLKYLRNLFYIFLDNKNKILKGKSYVAINPRKLPYYKFLNENLA